MPGTLQNPNHPFADAVTVSAAVVEDVVGDVVRDEAVKPLYNS